MSEKNIITKASFLILLFRTRVWCWLTHQMPRRNKGTIQPVHVDFATGLHLCHAQTVLQKDLNEIETVAQKLRDLNAAISSLDAQSW